MAPTMMPEVELEWTSREQRGDGGQRLSTSGRRQRTMAFLSFPREKMEASNLLQEEATGGSDHGCRLLAGRGGDGGHGLPASEEDGTNR